MTFSLELLFHFIIEDLIEALSYLPVGILAGALVLVAGRILTGKNQWMRFLFTVYIAALLQLAFFSREPGTRTGLDLELFATWGQTARARSYFIENILMFIPFGFLFPDTFGKAEWGWRCSWLCVASGGMFSIGLELLQFLTQRGHCQLDDVLTNTVGTAIGYVGFWLWRRGRRWQD